MSASLVGSEMCIRDRSRGSTLELGSSPRVPLSRLFRVSRVSLLERRGSVSYTHLTLPTICSV
eukprot:10533318-Alexandrium_andersonii.AAC.1